MQPRRILPLLAALLLWALVPTMLSTIQFSAQIEEPWNIAVVSETLSLARWVFIVALAHALILGLPLYLIARSRRHVGIVSCALGGFLVGAAPSALFELIGMFGLQSASTGGTSTVVNGVPTLAGWIEYAQSVGVMGLFGIAGGLTFWSVMRLSGQIPGKPKGNEPPVRPMDARAWGLVSTAGLLTAAMFLLPGVVKDNSCHNLFRDGRTEIGPRLIADFKLSDEDWPILMTMFQDFGAAHSLSFRSDKQNWDGNLLWRDLNLCNETGVNIDILDQPWLAQIHSPQGNQGIRLSVYELTPGSDWNALTRDLLDQLDKKWPDTVTFVGPGSEPISKEEALKGRE